MKEVLRKMWELCTQSQGFEHQVVVGTEGQNSVVGFGFFGSPTVK